MKQRIKRKLQNEGKWDYTNDCPIRETELKAATWKPAFLGESMIKEKYETLEQLNKSHPLLKMGSIVDGHFNFTLGAYDELGVPKTEGLPVIQSKYVLAYIGKLREAIREKTGETFWGNSLENSVQRELK